MSVIVDNPIPGTHATHVRADFQDSARDISVRDKRDAIARTQLVIENVNIPTFQGNSLDGDQCLIRPRQEHGTSFGYSVRAISIISILSVNMAL